MRYIKFIIIIYTFIVLSVLVKLINKMTRINPIYSLIKNYIFWNMMKIYKDCLNLGKGYNWNMCNIPQIQVSVDSTPDL